MIVCKFGGTSVQNAEAMERVVGILSDRRSSRPVVVASAMGKTTNRLLEAAGTAAAGGRANALEQLGRLKDYHFKEAQALLSSDALPPVLEQMQTHFKELGNLLKGLAILGELTPRSLDAIASYGERLSTLLLAAALDQRGLPARLLDSRKCIVTDGNFTKAAPLFDLTDAALRDQVLPVIDSGEIPVLQGFIGATQEGVTTTIGRGGSDYTAAIVGAAIDAWDIQIWTDVNGIMTTDPRIVPEARCVKVISFEEAAELAYFGAQVLHPATILPAVRKKIPVHVLNSYRPDHPGTLIAADAPPCANPIKAIACKKGITVVNITSTRMLMAHGFLKRIFEIFDAHRTSVDVVSTSEVSVSLTLDDTSTLWKVVTDLQKIGEVGVEGGKAIICCVGDNLRSIPGIAHAVFSSLRETNVHMISQGASAINMTFVIDEDRVERVLSDLHTVFFETTDPAVFE